MPLDLFGTGNLTLNAGGAVDLNLNGAALAGLNLTKSNNAAAFSLAGLAAGQSVTVTNAGGTAMTLPLLSS